MAYSNKKTTNSKATMQVTACIAALVVLITAIFGVISWGSEGFKQWDTSKWFNCWGMGDAGNNLTVAAVTDDGMVVSYLAEPDGGTALMSMRAGLRNSDSDYAGNTVVWLTATVTPEDAINTDVTWLVEFVNPDSAWARGKVATDYVAIPQTLSNGNVHMANIENVSERGFSEQIKVTAQSVDNPEISAACYVDYLARDMSHVRDFKATAVLDSSGNASVSAPVISKADMSEGTVYGDFVFDFDDTVNSSVYFNGVEEKNVAEYVKEQYPEDGSLRVPGSLNVQQSDLPLKGYRNMFSISREQQTYELSFDFNINTFPGGIDWLVEWQNPENGDMEDTTCGDLLASYVKRYGGTLFFSFRVNYVFENHVISKDTITLNVTFDNTAVQVHVDDVTGDKDHIVF